VVAPQASRAGLSASHGELREAPAPGSSRTGMIGDVGGHISTEPRINDRIRVPEVRLVGPSGEQVGIVSITDALRLAQEADLDLVEVAPTARPPVAKLMDFGKFKYESALKARESRKNQAQTVIKEIKIRPKIDPHDYGTKKGHVERFLRQGDKVKVTIMFRGREQSRPELGYKLLQRLAGDVEELGFVESQPKQDGRNMIMVIGPHRKKTDVKAVRAHDRASARATAPAAGRQDQAAAAAPRAAASRPASRQAATGGTQNSGSRETQPEPGAAPAGPRPGAASAPAQTAESSQASPRPGPPRPGPPAGGPRPAAPRPGTPGPSSGGSRPAAPKPGPSGGGARPAAPRPSAPRPQGSRSRESSPVTTPSARSARQGAAEADAGG
jgi:translation initiation factor IF-3